MKYRDLIDIHDILINIRFALKSEEALQMVIKLEEAIGAFLVENNNDSEISIRNLVGRQGNLMCYEFGTSDKDYLNCDKDVYSFDVIMCFFIIVHTIREKLVRKEYDYAFKIVDDVHEYPLHIVQKRKNAIKALKKYVSKLLLKD